MCPGLGSQQEGQTHRKHSPMTGRTPPSLFAYQSIGHGLLSVIQVHEVVIVARVHVCGHAGRDGEQEAFVVTWK